MPPPFVPLPTQEASAFVSSDIAFRGDFADWMVQEISIGDPEVFVANLAPITLHAKGLLNPKNRLTFSITPNVDAKLRFKDVAKTPDRCRLDSLGPHVVVLVLAGQTASQPGVDLTVKASNEGNIIQASKLGQGVAAKQIFIWYFKVIDPIGMVGWYDPGQLMRTGVEVFFSTLFGRHSDYRLMEALTPVGEDDQVLYHDFTRLRRAAPSGPDSIDEDADLSGEIWLDYVGDVGDGWNSTYAIAHSLAQLQLEVESPNGKKFQTNRGDILVFGGDQVYPIASRFNYAQRLLGPYETALDSTPPPHPHAFAIPGNHDWYDSLVSFTRLFCQKRWFAGWKTDQTRSYFALKLPGSWWLLGTDVQLDSDIDVPQVNFFKKVAKHIQPGDHVIVCTAEPHWISAKLYGEDDSNYNENNLAFFEKKIIPATARVVAFVAGDQHHYRRYEATNFTQKITSGGGGAFLHPTHGEQAKDLDGGYELKSTFPTNAKSMELGRKNVWFFKFNPWFGVLTAAIYLLTAWSVMANVGKFGIADIITALKTTLHAAMVNPFAVFWILAIFVGFLFFTDTHSKVYRWIAGPIHGSAHLAATFFIGWAAARIAWYLGLTFQSAYQLLFSAVFILLLGTIIGSTIMGLYLYVSLNWCNRHSNEAFSALKIEDWKNFLRFRIEANGNLTIFPIGFAKIPKKWKRRADGEKGAGYEPDDKSASVPVLIEQPLLFMPVPDQSGDVRRTQL